ncbi:winged helix domain-containing protein [Primorskyibacter sp. 2E233]|uniref:winged helix domain-containing protein n=1 Tax=Primorskyibacter sp. 2E233 TaxID=3413431 RepID=UPI003BF1CB66
MKVKAKIETGDTPITLHLKGRVAWTLLELVKAGDKGITPLHNPAPRVSHYVLTLRRKGVVIDTDMQPHGGAFPGEHGVYRLKSAVTIERVEGRT